MKYAPLLWAALRRRPLETLLVWVAISAAFALLGLMIGLYVHTQRTLSQMHMDRLYVVMRFPDQPYTGLPIALERQIARIDGVSGAGASRNVWGYHGDPHDNAGVMAVDEGMAQGWPEAPLTKSQWRQLFATRDGIFVSRKAAARWTLKAGDRFLLTVTTPIRGDGNPSWEFHVLDIVPDSPIWDQGLILGNYHYIDDTLPPGKQGLGNMFYVAVSDAARSVEISHRIDAHFANSGSATFTVPHRLDAEGLVNSNVNITAVTLCIAAAGMFMILFLTANALMRSVQERMPEFAVLMTVGYRFRQLAWLVAAEAAFPCLLGAFMGTALAALLVRVPAAMLGPDLRRMIARSDIPAQVLGLALLCALILALVSSILPLVRLRRLSVTDALAGR